MLHTLRPTTPRTCYSAIPIPFHILTTPRIPQHPLCTTLIQTRCRPPLTICCLHLLHISLLHILTLHLGIIHLMDTLPLHKLPLLSLHTLFQALMTWALTHIDSFIAIPKILTDTSFILAYNLYNEFVSTFGSIYCLLL